MNKTLGIILIVIGAAMLIWTGFSYTQRKKVVDVGPLQVYANQKHHVNWPPYLGTVVLIGGIVIVVMSKKSK